MTKDEVRKALEAKWKEYEKNLPPSAYWDSQHGGIEEWAIIDFAAACVAEASAPRERLPELAKQYDELFGDGNHALRNEQFYDADGNPCSLETLCRRDPGWAASRIRYERMQMATMVSSRCQIPKGAVKS